MGPSPVLVATPTDGSAPTVTVAVNSGGDGDLDNPILLSTGEAGTPTVEGQTVAQASLTDNNELDSAVDNEKDKAKGDIEKSLGFVSNEDATRRTNTEAQAPNAGSADPLSVSMQHMTVQVRNIVIAFSVRSIRFANFYGFCFRYLFILRCRR